MGKNTTEYQRQLEEYQERLRKKYDEMAGSDDDLDFLDDLPDVGDNDNAESEESDKEKIYDIDTVMLESKEDLLKEALGVAEAYSLEHSRENTEEAPDFNDDTDKEEVPGKKGFIKNVLNSISSLEHDVNDETSEDNDDGFSDSDDIEAVEAEPLYEDEEETAVSSPVKRMLNSKKHKKSRNYKWFIALGVILVLFVIVTICYLVSHARYMINKLDIHEINSSELMSNEGIKEQMSDYTTIALFGVDSKDGNKNQGANSDTIIIISINEKTGEMRMVSVYKDTYMYLENGLSDTNKVVYAYQTGGALSSINSLNVNLDLYITDYITVDYSAMADLIDALGGVTVTITEDEVNSLNKNLAEQISISGKYSDGVYDAGEQKLNGQQTVAYTRIKNVGTGDVTRTQRQRAVMTQIYNLIMEADKDTRKALIGLAIECISTSMTEDELLDLMSDFSDVTLAGSTAYPFNFDKALLDDKGTVMVASSMTENVSALHDFLYGTSGYVPTELVQNISAAISVETGIGDSGLTGSVVGTDSFETTEEETGPKTLTDAPSGMDVEDE